MSFDSNRRNSISAGRGGRRSVAILLALVSLGAVAAVWFWTSLLAVPVALLSWQNGVIVGGSGVFCLASMVALGLEDLLEWLWAVVAAMAAVVVAVFWGIMSVFGLD